MFDVKKKIDNFNLFVSQHWKFMKPIFSLDFSPGTFKLSKTKLRDEGFNVGQVCDPVYFMNPKTRQYEPLTESVYREIQAMNIRL